MPKRDNSDNKSGATEGINHIDKQPARLHYETDRLTGKLKDEGDDPTSMDADYAPTGKEQLLDKMEKDLKAEEGPLKRLIDGREDDRYDSPT